MRAYVGGDSSRTWHQPHIDVEITRKARIHDTGRTTPNPYHRERFRNIICRSPQRLHQARKMCRWGNGEANDSCQNTRFSDNRGIDQAIQVGETRRRARRSYAKSRCGYSVPNKSFAPGKPQLTSTTLTLVFCSLPGGTRSFLTSTPLAQAVMTRLYSASRSSLMLQVRNHHVWILKSPVRAPPIWSRSGF